MDYLKLTTDRLSVEAVSELVVDEKCGAVSLFVGTTRDNFDGKKVLHLEYEAYESMAINALKVICKEVREKWPSVHGIAMYHRLGSVPCKEASVVIAVSSPHRQQSLSAVSYCIDELKATVPIWKKEVYDGSEPVWKENKECSLDSSRPPCETKTLDTSVDKNLVQINVSSEELKNRIQNFIERKRDQINLSNIRDFIPAKSESEMEDTETCARVRTQFVKRSDSKGHLKIRRVYNEFGPQTVHPVAPKIKGGDLPSSISERVGAIESFLNTGPVAPDIYKRLKHMEDKITYLQSISPEYSIFWKNKTEIEIKEEPRVDYTYSAEDIAKKIEMLEARQSTVEYSD